MIFNSVNFLVLISSYYFYMSWNAKYAILIATSTVITWLGAILIEKSTRDCLKKIFLVTVLLSNLGILFFFKYFNFFLENINRILAHVNGQALDIPFDVLLPVGISFYTFQALGYTIDVYRKEVKAEKNILRYALFVSFFPQLVAGPIERSKNLLTQVNEEHYFEWERVKQGLRIVLQYVSQIYMTITLHIPEYRLEWRRFCLQSRYIVISPDIQKLQ